MQPVSLKFVLPLPPGVNNQYVTVGKRRVLSKSARAFKTDVKQLLFRQCETNKITATQERAIATSYLGVYLTFFFETPMRRDLDGGLKIALDAMSDGLDFDDRKVVDIHLVKRIDPLRPRLEVELETIHDWQFDESYVYLGGDSDNDSAG